MFLIKNKISLYEILEVSEDATESEIKSAFKKLAMKYHPDKVAGTDDAELKLKAEREMKKINRAKEILLDPEQRDQYNIKLNRSRKDNEDIFSEQIEIRLDDESLVIEWDMESSIDGLDNYDLVEDSTDSNNGGIIHGSSGYREQYQVKDTGISHSYVQSFCPKCGTRNIESSSTCPNCDESLAFEEKFISDQNKTIPTIQHAIPLWNQSETPPTTSVSLSAGIEIEPGVLFLQKCITCGNINIDGTPFCRSCFSSMIFDNDPEKFQFNKSSKSNSIPQNVPTKPGTINTDQTGTQNGVQKKIVLKKCLRCGEYNLMERAKCGRCAENMIYYQRDIRIAKPISDYQTDVKVIDEDEKIDPNSPTIECPKCGAGNVMGRKHCYSCFSNLIQLNQETSSIDYSVVADPELRKRDKNDGFIICPVCHSQNLNHMNFCHKCNTRIRTIQEPIEIQIETRPGDKKSRSEEGSELDKIIECPYCGTKNALGSDFCDSCYKSLIYDKFSSRSDKPTWSKNPEVEIIDHDVTRCGRCGYKLNHNYPYCINCGLMY